MIRRALLALCFLASLLATPALAQTNPIPALPDSQRLTTYTISGTTCACAVGFQLYGDGSDYQNWVEVFLNGVTVSNTDPTFGWTLTSPSGAVSTLPRPITDAIITFNSSQTGTVTIVGAQRPRRLSVFSENQGVTAHAFNQIFNSIFAELREVWDKINDFTGRGLFGQPGTQFSPLPPASQCVNGLLSFGADGKTPTCAVTPGLSRTSIVIAVRSSNAPTVTVSSTTDYFLCLDPTANAITVNLPAPVTGMNYIVKDCTGASLANPITLTPTAGVLIDGFSSFAINSSYQSVGITYTGAQWSLN